MECRCIIGAHFVAYNFLGTVTLTFDQVSKIIVFRAYLLYCLIKESQICVWLHLGLKECCVPLLGPCDLDFDLIPRFLEAIWFLVHISPILFGVRIANLVCGCRFRVPFFWSL